MRKYTKTVGILGGMGPEATAKFYTDIINRCQSELGAKYNSDFPYILINSVPIPDGKMWRGFDQDLVISILQENCRLLEDAKADFIAVPCNSAHYFINKMRESVGIPVFSIIEETSKRIKKAKLECVSILATNFTVSKGLYEAHLSKEKINLIRPSNDLQKRIDEIIISIESGNRSKANRDVLIEIIKDLGSRGAEGVILGCTEIPLIIKQDDVSIPLFDTLGILTDSTFNYLIGAN